MIFEQRVLVVIYFLWKSGEDTGVSSSPVGWLEIIMNTETICLFHPKELSYKCSKINILNIYN